MFRRGVLVVGVLVALAAAAPARAEHDPSCGVLTVPVHAGTLVYRLERGFLRAGSDTVRVRGVPWTRGTDYELDALRGEIRLLHDPVPGDTLAVQACWLLDPPPLERERMALRGGGEAPVAATSDTAPAVTPRAGVSRARLDDASGVSLALSGSKSVAVEFGSQQDAFLKQSLDLTLSGTLAPGVELTGVLSDRNTPLTTTGSTQDLQALDRVLLELKAPGGDAQLGDVDLALGQGEFLRVDRRLQGMSAMLGGGATSVRFAAASVPGQHHRLEFYGTEGFQGPYTLTDDQGGTAISVVAGSEVVTLDGQRLTRGDAADYAMDYDAARITFTSRHPISASTRITIEYQFSSDAFQRRLVGGGGRWGGDRAYLYGGAVDESDDRGRPTAGTLTAADLVTLAFAGDSAARAVVPDVSDSGGDYDTVRVDSAHVAYAFVGPGGHFAVPFTRVGTGEGDYQSYPVASGTAFRFVGIGNGDYRVGRTLPLPQSHQLANAGGGVRWGPLAAEVEGAVSRLDRNTLSSLDDGDDVGRAGRARVALETAHAGWGLRRLGLAGTMRDVDPRFAAFSTLSESFAAEAWGLAPGADVDHRRERALEAFAEGGAFGALHGTVGHLATPGGFTADRRELSYARSGLLAASADYAWAAGADPSLRHPDGSREHADATLKVALPWIEPAVHASTDRRLAPSDSIGVGARTRIAGADLSTGARLAWQASVGWELRREALPGPTGFVDQGETRALTTLLRSPDRNGWGGELRYEHRQLRPLANPDRTSGDFGSLRLHGEERPLGLTGQLDVEVTGDGETRTERSLTYVGPGRGTYDALGNYVGTGDYTLAIGVAPGFDRVSRAVTSAHLGWEYAPAAWLRGSRTTFDYETETRRRGDLGLWDPWVAPGVVLGDRGLALGSLRQRLESDVAPESRAAAFHLRLERQVSSDRQVENFAQTLDHRTASLRWRTRPTDVTTTELQASVERQAAVQALAGVAGLARTLFTSGLTGQVVVTPGARLRVAAVAEAAWTRPEGATELSRSLRIGPDVGIAVGTRGHADLSIRRGFESGAPAVSLLPTSVPAGVPVWDSTARFDYHVRESSTVGVTTSVIQRPGLKTAVTGRAEVRAFF